MNHDYGTVTETPDDGLPAVHHPGWAEAFPWLVQGTTVRGSGEEPFDLALFGAGSPPMSVASAFSRLRRATGMSLVVHARQVHEAAVRLHRAGPSGLLVTDPCDGHATPDAGVLLAVTVADCVPVFVVDPERRAVALLHAGWRGAAAGILERGIAVLGERCGTAAEEVLVHLGPSICGDCYEVGPEVFAALGLDVPAGPTPVDLRGALARRAEVAGVDAGSISISTWCTRCGDGVFFSHRGGDPQRQVGFLGVRP